MTRIRNFEQHYRSFVEPDLSIETRLQMAMEVRDSLEITRTPGYLNFLKCYFQAFSGVLLQITKPQFTYNPENKLRNTVLEILSKLLHSVVLQLYVQDIIKVAMQVLTTDNEENGLICIRIIFDLLKSFKPAVENEIQPFLDFVCKIYHNFGQTVSHFFDNAVNAVMGMEVDVKPMDTSSVSDQGIIPSRYVGNEQLNPSTCSFKIVTETPLVVLLIFQLYSRLVETKIPQLLPLMGSAISVPVPEMVPPHLKTQFIELKAAQVKTVYSLTKLLKSFPDHIRPHEESICKSIVNLLVTFSDSISIRKELLIGLKHVLGTDYKRGLFPFIDTLLEDRVLVGTGQECFEILRPLAYSLRAEIVHHARADLSLYQLSQVIYLFSSNMHDASLSLGIHVICARVMLNLEEPIFKKGVDQPSMDEARVLLVLACILDAFVRRFSAFKHTIPQAVLCLQVPLEHSKEVSFCMDLIKILVLGMKFIKWRISVVDGTCDMETLKAFAGGLLKDSAGRWIGGFMQGMGGGVPTGAELTTAVSGVRSSQQSDSREAEQLIQQVSNRLWKLLAEQFEVMEWNWIEANRCADLLANLGVEGAEGVLEVRGPPSAVEMFFE